MLVIIGLVFVAQPANKHYQMSSISTIPSCKHPRPLSTLLTPIVTTCSLGLQLHKAQAHDFLSCSTTGHVSCRSEPRQKSPPRCSTTTTSHSLPRPNIIFIIGCHRHSLSLSSFPATKRLTFLCLSSLISLRQPYKAYFEFPSPLREIRTLRRPLFLLRLGL